MFQPTCPPLRDCSVIQHPRTNSHPLMLTYPNIVSCNRLILSNSYLGKGAYLHPTPLDNRWLPHPQGVCRSASPHRLCTHPSPPFVPGSLPPYGHLGHQQLFRHHQGQGTEKQSLSGQQTKSHRKALRQTKKKRAEK